jgi:hypothetical protein
MKVSGSSTALVRGVSEQVEHFRQDGQVSAQDNMIPDPVSGLCRRHGSELVAETRTAWSPDSFAAASQDTAGWRTFEYETGGTQYALMVRHAARPAGSPMPPVVAFNQTTAEFMPVVRPVTDAVLDMLESGGCSAITSVGKYVFMAGHTIVPASTSVDAWGDAANQAKAVVWIRGGAFSRTFKVRALKTDNSAVDFEYTTPSAAYPGLLDTSGVSPLAADTTGSSTVSAPSIGRAVEYLTSPVEGATVTLVHAGSTITNLTIEFNWSQNDNVEAGTYVEGVHYTISAGGVLTWLFTDTLLQRGGSYFAYMVYDYQTSPTGGTATLYTTSTDSETLYVKRVQGKGVATLYWGNWNPTGLSVTLGNVAMTNVHPSITPGPGQYSWAPGGRTVLFSEGYVGNLTISALYTHTKTVPNPNYANLVGELTSEYQRNVTAWIASSSAAIAPSAIAEQLLLAAQAAGLTTATRQDSTIIFDNVKQLTVQDGGDGSLIRGVANEVTSIDDVSALHSVGKIVRVRASGSEESFYLKAVAKDSTVTSGYTTVSWAEAAGTVHTITSALIYGVAVGGTFYMASSAAALALLTPGPHPGYSISTVGDADSSPLPHFVGRKIGYLGVFQDRLLVGSGAVLRASKVGDYLNFFRSSVLTAAADDPLEMLSQGSEDDELRFSVLYDRDLVIFGRDRQYVVSGRSALTPTSANMPVMSSHEGAGDTPPVATSSLLFYAKRGPRSSNVYQIQPGKIAESPESFPISSQASTYLAGDALEMVSTAAPSALFLRSGADRSVLYVFSYLDVYEERRQDAWHRWKYNVALGPIIGMAPTKNGLLLFTLRKAQKADSTGEAIWLVADNQPLAAGLSQKPYLDSMRTWEAVADLGGLDPERSVNPATLGEWSAAFDSSTEYRLFGGELIEGATLVEEFPEASGLMAGADYVSLFTPTRAIVRDSKGGAITTGRLTVTKHLVSYTDSSGFIADVVTSANTTTTNFNGRVMGDADNIIGREPVTTGQTSITVGREARDYRLTIKARRWFPLNVTVLDWVGQFFNRTQRIS